MTTVLWFIGGVIIVLLVAFCLVVCFAAHIGEEMDSEAWRQYMERKEREAACEDDSTQTLPTIPGDGN